MLLSRGRESDCARDQQKAGLKSKAQYFPAIQRVHYLDIGSDRAPSNVTLTNTANFHQSR